MYILPSRNSIYNILGKIFQLIKKWFYDKYRLSALDKSNKILFSLEMVRTYYTLKNTEELH